MVSPSWWTAAGALLVAYTPSYRQLFHRTTNRPNYRPETRHDCSAGAGAAGPAAVAAAGGPIEIVPDYLHHGSIGLLRLRMPALLPIEQFRPLVCRFPLPF